MLRTLDLEVLQKYTSPIDKSPMELSVGLEIIFIKVL